MSPAQALREAGRIVGDHVLGSFVDSKVEWKTKKGYQGVLSFDTHAGYRLFHLHPHSQTCVMEDGDLEARAPAKT